MYVRAPMGKRPIRRRRRCGAERCCSCVTRSAFNQLEEFGRIVFLFRRCRLARWCRITYVVGWFIFYAL